MNDLTNIFRIDLSGCPLGVSQSNVTGSGNVNAENGFTRLVHALKRNKWLKYLNLNDTSLVAHNFISIGIYPLPSRTFILIIHFHFHFGTCLHIL